MQDLNYLSAIPLSVQVFVDTSKHGYREWKKCAKFGHDDQIPIWVAAVLDVTEMVMSEENADSAKTYWNKQCLYQFETYNQVILQYVPIFAKK